MYELDGSDDKVGKSAHSLRYYLHFIAFKNEDNVFRNWSFYEKFLQITIF